MENKNLQLATFGGGCFWCTEAVFREIKGVEQVFSGYSGGNVPGHPTYKEVCSGLTGHAEVVQVTFDANTISYKDILIIFITTHDPTTLNRQGGDVGTQYRSVIYYHDDNQKKVAEIVLKEMTSYFDDPIVTELTALDVFFKAENYHQDYYNNNTTQGYCSMVISPKLSKFRKAFSDKLK